jgi:hypothetical protein
MLFHETHPPLRLLWSVNKYYKVISFGIALSSAA